MRAPSTPCTDLEQAYGMLELLRSTPLSPTTARLTPATIAFYIESQLLSKQEVVPTISLTTYVWVQVLHHMVQLDLTLEQMLVVRRHLHTRADIRQDLLSPALLKQLELENFSPAELAEIKALITQTQFNPTLRIQAGITELEKLLCLSSCHKAVIGLRLLPDNEIIINSNRMPEEEAFLTLAYIQIPLTAFLLPLLDANQQELFVLSSSTLSSAEVAAIEAMRASYIREVKVTRQETKGRLAFVIETKQQGLATEALFDSLNNSIRTKRFAELRWRKEQGKAPFFEYYQKRRIVS